MAKRTDRQIQCGIFFDSTEEKEYYQSMLWSIKNITKDNFPVICLKATEKYLNELKNEKQRIAKV